MIFKRNKNRAAAVAGQFYPATSEILQDELIQLFRDSRKPLPTTNLLRALIVPHAGYIFSGSVAASAYKQIPENKSYKNVFVIASSHQYAFTGASVYTDGNYETPLGEIKVNKKLAEQLIKSPVFNNRSDAHLYEHSLEVQLPFLQFKLGKNFKLVPIILGTRKPEDCFEIAQQLKPYFTTDNLFLISTDFSHFPTYETANEIDRITADSILKNSAKELLKTLQKNKERNILNLDTSLCGWTSVLTLLYLTENHNLKLEALDYKNSGDARDYSDKKRVVGYWAIGIFEKPVFELSETDKKAVLQLAHNSISKYLGQDVSKISYSADILNKKAGVFISVYVNDKLRGCIGGFSGEKTLKELIKKHAVSAAFDHRFESVKAEELKNMKIEVSILSPLHRINSIDELELGRHGIYIRSGLNTGTFLPQVANKTGWSKEEFLERCSKDKARLGWDGWKTAELFTYEVTIIKED